MCCEVTGWREPGEVASWSHSEAADVRETLELLWEVVFVEHRVGAVLHHLQRHRAEHRRKLVDALGSEGGEHKWVSLKQELGLPARWILCENLCENPSSCCVHVCSLWTLWVEFNCPYFPDRSLFSGKGRYKTHLFHILEAIYIILI